MLAIPLKAELVAVPFYVQESHQCGPAALAMVLNAGRVKSTPQALTDQIYLPGRLGSLQVELLASTRRNGFLAYQLAPQLEDILEEVAGGTPVLVLQNLAFSLFPVWHYAVVVGYDLKREELILRSGYEERQILSFKTFEYTWARSEHWAMLALEPGAMPRTVNQDSYVSSAVALENTGQSQGALLAYISILQRWPENLAARIGEGNIAYAAGDTLRAEIVFRRATLDHPDSAIAFNNLAQVLADMGRLIEAEVFAKRAVSLGGAQFTTALETLRQIERSR